MRFKSIKQNNINIFVRKTRCDDVNGIQIAQNMGPLLAVQNTIMKSVSTNG